MSRDIFSPIDIIKLLPKRPLSKLVGTLTELEVPSPILDTAIEIYKKAYNVERRDFAEGEKYSCFQDYFIRDLLPGRREFAGDKNDFVSPVDGTYSEKIQIRKGSMIKAKDYQFSVAQLLSCYQTAAEYENGTLACLYLAPGNYHKIHMPIDGKARQGKYIAGEKWPVFPSILKKVDSLFAVNERAWIEFETDSGPFIMILVGALCVGKLYIDQIGVLESEPYSVKDLEVNDLSWNKGDEFGKFLMGSTVLLLSPEGGLNWDEIDTPSVIHMGEKIARFEK